MQHNKAVNSDAQRRPLAGLAPVLVRRLPLRLIARGVARPSAGAGLFEMRLKSQEGIGRVFYCTLVRRWIVMLHQFGKKTDKTPPKELVVARKRLKEWKDADA
jgi:hypothetical protein